MPLADDLRSRVEARSAELRDLRRDLHAHPELAWGEVRTTEVVSAALTSAGVAHRRLEGTGLIAEVGDTGPLVALRGDIDALPLADATTDPWRSRTPGAAHACGHDVHTAALVGAAVALHEQHAAAGLPVRVRLLFQPAEEVMPGGAHQVIDAGGLEGVSAIYAVHCDPSIDVGQVGLREGPLTGAADAVRLVLHGRGGHTSRPHLTQDLTYALASIVTGLPSALSRRLDPRAGASMVWGAMNAGNAINVIPASGEASGTLRMLDVAAWHEAEPLVRRLVGELAAPFGLRVELSFTRGVPPVVNDRACTDRWRDAVGGVLGAGAATTTPQSLGGEDFAWYAQSVPGAMARLGTRTPGGATYDLHQPDLRIDERAVGIAAALLATVAVQPL